ncbi:choice-of-anchor D domain-containing protein [Archangium violaceum]|uniref:choice-of-anchor D domain-containing protein n=1 Tax=Archangium violaceum TaxID=83451 RepID=UPI002B292BAF|nr:choice-of-anchor D domain-containing protein [Archangium gephyra]
MSNLTASPSELEFGPSAVGVSRVMKVWLSNEGGASLTIHGATVTAPNVEVMPFEPFELKAGGARELEVRFTPNGDGAVRGALEVRTDADNVSQGVMRLGVGGEGVKPRVEVRTPALDFHGVELGNVGLRELVVGNPTRVESPVRLDFDGTDADLFTSNEAGVLLMLEPGEERRLPVSFKPTRPGALQASARVTVCSGCEPTVVPLMGTGLITSKLTVSPRELAFGLSAVGVTRVMKVRLANDGWAPLTIHGVGSTLPNVEVVPFESFTLRSGGARELGVRFTPDAEGVVRGVLEVITDADNVSQEGVMRLGVTGQGVKAWVEVKTPALDFGDVELGNVGLRELVVHNPTPVESPVRLDFDGTDADLFSSSEAGAPFKLQPGEERRVPVSFNPQRLGTAQAIARLMVCPMCEPAVVQLTGTGTVTRLEVTPLRVDFGRVSLGATAEERITVRNLGPASMAYGGVKLLDNVSGAFRVVSAPTLPGNVLAAGASFEVKVAFSPTASGPVRGARLEIDVRPVGSSTPGPKVTLEGDGGASCVVSQLESLDFGVVAEGMSVTGDVRVVNRCRTDVLMSDVKLSTKKGGYFLLAAAPSSMPIPAGESVAVPITFSPRAGVGEGEAELSVKVLEGRSTSTEVVKVLGTGRVFSPCQYKLEPATVDFGSVPVGSEVTLSAAVRNIGSTDCFVAGMQLAEGSDTAFAADKTGNTVLSPGQRALLLVRFKPGEEGELTGMAEGWVNHPSNGHALVLLRGRGVRGCFSVQPTTLDFGVTHLSCGPKERELVVYNKCAGPTTVVSMTPEGDTSDFKLTHGLFFPATLAANSQSRIKVMYEPQSDGEDAAALRFDLGTGAPYTVGLVGKGVTKIEQTDEFVQQSQAKVDVLFVVDNSGSMMDEQQNLGQNFSAFLTHAAAAGVDYHIAVTTTGLERSSGGWAICPGGAEGGENGRFFPVDNSSPRIITPTTPSAEAVFARNTQVGVCHWNEQGLEAMYRALSSPLVYSPDDPRTPSPLDGNASFLREDARLAVIVVTDEEDFSLEPVSAYETFLLGLKSGDHSKVRVSAIAGPKDLATCPKASSSGNRYIELAEKTGGVVESICTPNWADSLEKLSESAFGPNRTFQLSEGPLDPSRIVVRVDGVEVTTGWTYDSLANTIRFDTNSVPATDARVEVTYTVGC